MQRQVSNNPKYLTKLKAIESKIGQNSLSELLGVSTRYVRYIKENQRSLTNQQEQILKLYKVIDKKYKNEVKLTAPETDNLIIKYSKPKKHIKRKTLITGNEASQTILNFKNKYLKLKNFNFNADLQYKKAIKGISDIINKIKKFPFKVYINLTFEVKEDSTVNNINTSTHTFLINKKTEISKYLKRLFQTFKEYQIFVSNILKSMYRNAQYIKLSGLTITIIKDKNERN